MGAGQSSIELCRCWLSWRGLMCPESGTPAAQNHPISGSDPAPERTPLHALHLRLGGRMVPFAGYEMPLHYPAGLLKEHLHTRSGAGLFDVSHMGQIAV